ncbi:hypothetical protein ACVRWB_07870 [Streptococcus troglodytae]
MNQKSKKSLTPLVLGIFSLPFAIFPAIVGLILGIAGLILAINKNKEEEFNYRIEIILNSLGIIIAAINMVIGFIQGFNNGM